MIGDIIMLALPLVITAACIYGMFCIGLRSGRKLLALLLAIHVLLPAAVIYFLFPQIFAVFSNWLWILSAAAIVERIVWAFTLKEVAGNDELAWFYIIYIVPVGWLIYRGAKIR